MGWRDERAVWKGTGTVSRMEEGEGEGMGDKGEGGRKGDKGGEGKGKTGGRGGKGEGGKKRGGQGEMGWSWG